MQTRRLGRTELMVPLLGLGGMGVIAQCHPSREEAIRLVVRALDLGMNLIETARGYFDSEEIIGSAITGRRDGVILASKSFLRSGKAMEKELEQSLGNFKTSHIDLYQIHHVQYADELEQVMGKGGALQVLESARREGVIGHIGVTSHHPAMLTRCLETDRFDTVQLPLSPVERSFFDSVYPAARKRDVGILVMKPLAGGNIGTPESVAKALRYVLSHDVGCVLLGCSRIEQVELDVAVAGSWHPLNEAERRELEEEVSRLPEEFCRRCRYCEGVCPQKIAISDIFRMEDYLILNATYARNEYRTLKINALACEDCGACERICPYNLKVRHKLKLAHQGLTRGRLEDMAVNFLRRIRLYDLVRKFYFEWGGRLPRRQVKPGEGSSRRSLN